MALHSTPSMRSGYISTVIGRARVSVNVKRYEAANRSGFLANTSDQLRRLGLDASPHLNFWDYFESIPASDFDGHDCSAGGVTYVWEEIPPAAINTCMLTAKIRISLWCLS